MDGEEPDAMQALTALCESYWYPIYAFIRRSGHAPPDAEDLAQGFFAWLLSHGALAKADASLGKLRSFLLTCVRRFLSDQHDRAMAQKRGAAVLTTFDAARAEQRYASEPVDQLSPDRLFQRRWALTIVDQGLTLLRQEFAADGKAGLFTALRPFLGFSSGPAGTYEEVAAALRMPVATVKSHVFRLRKRWRELIFEQVALTLDDPTPEEIRGELGELLGCV
jgi:DNA-directed RNA polymerase specialized sigma24 family protein